MEALRGHSADSVWRQAFATVATRSEGGSPQPSRAGDTYEVLHVALQVNDPRQRWVISRTPAINPAFGLAEVLWILAGSNDAAFLNYWFTGLPKFAGEGPTYAGAYGYRLRRHFAIDQLLRACDVLSSNPDSRQVVLQLWDVNSDMPRADGTPRASDVPCNVVSLLKLREGRLDWTQVMRSTDLHRGLPYNLVQFTVLQELIAGWLGVDVGRYHHWSDSLHAYAAASEQFACVEETAEERNVDSLALDFATGVRLVDEVYRRATQLTLSGITAAEVNKLVQLPEAPPGYQNWLRVLGAEAARRQRRPDQAEHIMASCSNPQIVQVWTAWWHRVQPSRKGARTEEGGLRQ